MTTVPVTETDHQAAAWAVEAAAGAEVLVNIFPNAAGAASVARGICTSRIRAYQRAAGTFEAHAYPAEGGAAVWARYTPGPALEPLPQTLTVRVSQDRRVVTVEISARCQVCGGPRGELRDKLKITNDVWHVHDEWTNPCGHTDTTRTVLAEARRRATQREGAASLRPKGGDLAGVEGGAYCAAVDLIAAQAGAWPWLSALAAADLLDENGEHRAADVVREFRRTSGSGTNTSARSAALYLIHCDTEAAALRAAEAETAGGTK